MLADVKTSRNANSRGQPCESVCVTTHPLPEKEADNLHGSGYTVPLTLFVQEMTAH